jgi:Protein of unknown function (DUF2695)
MESDRGFIEAIASDVLEALRRVRFFEALDDQMCPTCPAQPRALCRGSYAISTTILTDRGFDSDAIGEVIRVLDARGAHCDCEILFNVAEDSRLKSEYWISRATGDPPRFPKAHEVD